MRLVADSGLWSTATHTRPGPLVALVEVSGAVLSWTVDESAAAPEIAFTDARRADWLWQVLGESGHLAITEALDGPPPDGSSTIELAGVDVLAGPTERLRRLAVGHWLRRWWPASERDGIAGLDPALLDAELAVLTAAAQDFFTDDTLDSDVGELLSPHPSALTTQVRGGDRRVVDLARSCAELADEIGLDGAGWAELREALEDANRPLQAAVAAPAGRRDDYALAAGAGAPTGVPGVIASGVGSIQWTAVPPGIFDAAENTVTWAVEVDDAVAVATIQVVVSGPHPATGITVRMRSGDIGGAGVLAADGRAVLRLVAAQQPVSEATAWGHSWPATTVTVGAEVSPSGESPEIRDRVRRLARTRLQRPSEDAYLTEIVAAESDY